MSNNKKTKKALEKLKVKRAKYAAGGYGYTGGSRRKADSVSIKETPVVGTRYKKGTGTVPETGPKPKKSDPDSLFSDPPRGDDGRQGPRGGSRGVDPSKDTRVVGNDGRTYFNQAEADKANERYAKKQAEPNPLRDAVMGNRNSTFGGYGNNNNNDTSGGTGGERLDNGDSGTGYPTIADPQNPTPAELAALQAYFQENPINLNNLK